MSQTTTLNRKPIIDGLTLPKANKTRPPGFQLQLNLQADVAGASSPSYNRQSGKYTDNEESDNLSGNILRNVLGYIPIATICLRHAWGFGIFSYIKRRCSMVLCPIRRMLVRSIQMPLSQYLPKAILRKQTQIRHCGLLPPALCVDTHDSSVPTFGCHLGGGNWFW